MTHTSENAPSNRLTYNVNDNNDVDASTMTLPMSSAPAPVESSDPEPALAVFLAKTSEPAKPPTAENNGSESPRSSALFKSSEELAVLRSNINLMADQLQVLLQKEESEAAAARLLNQLSVRLREARSAQQLFSVAVTEARETLQADRAIVYLFDEQWKGTVVAESVAKGWKAALGDKIADPCFAERYVESYRRGRVSVITNVFEAGLTECHLGQLIPYGIRANLVVPILSNQKLLGLLIAHQCSGPRAWHETEVDFLAKFAIQVGYAYDQITVMEQQSTTARQANLLNRISSRIRETLRPKEIFNVATQETRDALQADRVIVYQFDEKWQGSVVSESIGRGWKASLGANIADPCFAERYVEPYRLGRVSATPNIYEAGLTPAS
jgi:methyl-accepting chemotaxis protein PixJ